MMATKRMVSAIFPIRKSLLKGILIFGPVGIILWVVVGIVGAVNIVGDKLITFFMPDRRMAWGIGFMVVLFVVLVIGRIELHYEGHERSLWHRVKRKTLGRLPVIGPSFVGRGGRFVSYDDLEELTPCKFWLSLATPYYGFIVGEQPVRGGDTEVIVYRPKVPTIIPGDLFPLKRQFVIKLANPPSEILNKLASAGLIVTAEDIPVPWDDESTEEFQERLRRTPLEIAIKRLLADNPRDQISET
jgi:uncharacterized membrane protein